MSVKPSLPLGAVHSPSTGEGRPADPDNVVGPRDWKILMPCHAASRRFATTSSIATTTSPHGKRRRMHRAQPPAHPTKRTHAAPTIANPEPLLTLDLTAATSPLSVAALSHPGRCSRAAPTRGGARNGRDAGVGWCLIERRLGTPTVARSGPRGPARPLPHRVGRRAHERLHAGGRRAPARARDRQAGGVTAGRRC